MLALVPPPGFGFTTVMGRSAAFESKDAGIDAVIDVAELNTAASTCVPKPTFR